MAEEYVNAARQHDFTTALEMERRVRLALEPDHIGVWPDHARVRRHGSGSGSSGSDSHGPGSGQPGSSSGSDQESSSS